jgi:hypothetical protein
MAQPSIEAIRLAYALHVVRSIVDADDVMTLGEMRLVAEQLPAALLFAHGLIDEDGSFTDYYVEALDGAAARLREAMTLDERLELVALFHRATVADGVLEVAEYDRLRDAWRELGLSDAEVSAHLDSLAVGSSGSPPIR